MSRWSRASGSMPSSSATRFVVERELPLADPRVALELVELDERDRRQHIREVRLVAGDGEVVERAVAAAHQPQLPHRVGDVVGSSRSGRPRRRRRSSSRRARSRWRQRGRRSCVRGSGSRPRGRRPRPRAGRARAAAPGRTAGRPGGRAGSPSCAPVTAAAASSGSMLRSPSRTSTNTGVAPVWTITFAVAGQVIGVVITSSPGPMPSATRLRCMAAVPDATASTCSASR